MFTSQTAFDTNDINISQSLSVISTRPRSRSLGSGSSSSPRRPVALAGIAATGASASLSSITTAGYTESPRREQMSSSTGSLRMRSSERSPRRRGGDSSIFVETNVSLTKGNSVDESGVKLLHTSTSLSPRSPRLKRPFIVINVIRARRLTFASSHVYVKLSLGAQEAMRTKAVRCDEECKAAWEEPLDFSLSNEGITSSVQLLIGSNGVDSDIGLQLPVVYLREFAFLRKAAWFPLQAHWGNRGEVNLSVSIENGESDGKFDLQVTVFECKNLFQTDEEAKNAPALLGTSPMMARLSCGGQSFIGDMKNEFFLDEVDKSDDLMICIYYSFNSIDCDIGRCVLPVLELLREKEIVKQWFPLTRRDLNAKLGDVQLSVKIRE